MLCEMKTTRMLLTMIFMSLLSSTLAFTSSSSSSSSLSSPPSSIKDSFPPFITKTNTLLPPTTATTTTRHWMMKSGLNHGIMEDNTSMDNDDDDDDETSIPNEATMTASSSSLSRRGAFVRTVLTTTAAAATTNTILSSSSSSSSSPTISIQPTPVYAIDDTSSMVPTTVDVITPSPETVVAPPSTTTTNIDKVVVVGATGQTGSKIYYKLQSMPSISTVTGGVRNIAKATKSLSSSSSDTSSSSTTTTVSLKHIDVVEDTLEDLISTLQSTNANGLIIACGMNPGKNLLRMKAAAHEVDNVGTCKLIDAAKNAGNIKKVILLSSILTNGREWGQEDSPGFQITNAFGNALDEKLVAEKYVKSSGLDYTIVRPGGLQVKLPMGALSLNPEDTLNSGEISRDLVADVCIASLNDSRTSRKVLEIIEDESKPPTVFDGLPFM